MFDQEIMDDFITEANEHLADVEDDILAMESDGADINVELVNNLFRAVHTIKGSSGFLDLKKVKELSHSLENVMGLVRDGKLIPSEIVSDTLLKGVDKLKLLIDNIGDESIEIEEEIAKCEKCICADDKKSSEDTSQKSDIKNIEKQFDLSKYDLKSAVDNNDFVYEYTIDLVKECTRKRRSFKSIERDLNDVGEVWDIKKNLSKKNMPIKDAEGESLCSFLLSTLIADSGIITEGLDVEPIQIIMYSPEELAAFNKKHSEDGTQRKSKSANDDLVEIFENDSADPGKRKSDTPVITPAKSPAEAPEQKKETSSKPSNTESIPSTSQSGSPAAQKMVDQTVRISVSLLDKLMNMASELVLVRNQNVQAIAAKDIQQLTAINQQLNIVTSELQNDIMQTRMRPVGTVFNKFNRVVRDMAKKLGKKINLSIVGADVELDKSIIEAIGDPLTHLIRNSVDHGVELPGDREKKGKPPNGEVRLSAFHQAGQVNIQIVDDGKGMDPELLKESALKKKIITKAQAEAMSDRDAFNLIFKPGFSTAETVTEVSGRGVGMDVVKTGFQKLGGTVDIQSTLDKGTTITIVLPLTLAIIPALIISVEDTCFAVPQANTIEVVWLYGSDMYQSIKTVDGKEVYSLRGRLLPLLRLSKVLGINKRYINPVKEESMPDRRNQVPDRRQETDDVAENLRSGPVDRRVSFSNSLSIIVLKHGSEKFGLVVDTIMDMEEIVVKPLHEQLKGCKAFAGTTVLGDGNIAMILDITAIAELGALHIANIEKQIIHTRTSDDDQQTMLIFDTGGEEQFILPLCLITRVEKIKIDQIQHVNDREYLNFRDSIIPLIRIEQALPGIVSSYDNTCQYVIIPKGKRTIGIMAANIIDTREIRCKIDSKTIRRKGVFGSQLIGDRISLFLDTIAIIKEIEPEWFKEKEPDEKEKEKKRILFVDDSTFYQNLIRTYLSGSGLEVTVAGNGREALDMLEKESFDGIVSDIEMPVMDGFEFAKHVRTIDKYKDVPLLAISAIDEEVMRSRVFECGFDNFRLKINLEVLLETVINLFSVKPAD